MSEFWTAFGQALLILAALALFVAWVICTMVGVAAYSIVYTRNAIQWTRDRRPKEDQ